ncbi:SIS domain-containing protein [bacterium]|nr:SIS domain-containing protein [bacterium]
MPGPSNVDRTFGARIYRAALADHRAAIDDLGEEHLDALLAVAVAVCDAWAAGGKLLVCGNGGSAADAQHIAAELVGRFERNRPAYAALALNVNASVMTAVGNDYGFQEIFARQVTGLGNARDVLLVLSTSGNSENCVQAVEAAHEMGMTVFGFLGHDGGDLAGLVDGALIAPGASTATIQELHITMGHVLCRILESWLVDEAGDGAAQ